MFLLGVLGKQTVQQAQHVRGSRPREAVWPLKKADKTQICWVPWSQNWPSTAPTCSHNTTHLNVLFLHIQMEPSTITHSHQPRGEVVLMK